MNAPSLVLQAGPRAIRHIREFGLRPQDIDIVPGAAGGPKGLGLARLDEWLFADWLPQAATQRTTRINLIGASIGAWRFSAVCRGHRAEDTRATLAELTEAYCQQNYPRGVSAAHVSQCAEEVLLALFQHHEQEMLTHPLYRLNVLVVRGKGMLRRESRSMTPAGFALAALANAAGRRHLRHFLDRVWFTAEGAHPLLTEGENFDAFHTHHVALTPGNLISALAASGAIPLALKGVAHIEGASTGTFWDGGIIDYHLHLPYSRVEGLVLYPHFTDRIVPGWLDKGLPWRRARGHWLDNVLLVSPSRDYLARLPFGRLPNRNDFKTFVGDHVGRLKFWHFAIAESARLRDELAQLIESGDIVNRLKPLD